jgi:hypothetical protein
MQLYSEILGQIYQVVVEILRCEHLAFWCVFEVDRLPVWPANP